MCSPAAPRPTARDHLEELFNRYEVDVVVSGHVHSYSSSCNVLDETCIRREEGGMMHFIVSQGCASG